MLLQQRCRDFASRLIILLLAGAACWSGCGGGGGGGQPQPPQPQTALVVGDASGTVYDELASAYHASLGTGMEPPAGFDLLIYGQSLTPEQIETLPSTDSFLNAGKILIVLDPTLEDLEALEGSLGAAVLVDTPALAIFKTFYGDRGLQTATVVEFPAIQNEDPTAAEDSSLDAGNLGQPAGANAYEGDTAMRAQAGQWRKLYEQMHVDTWRTMRALANVSSAGLTAAAIDDSSSASPVTAASSSPGGTDLSSWLDAPASIDPALTSPFWTVRQLRETKPVTFKMQSAVYQAKLLVDGSVSEGRGLCTFLPTAVAAVNPGARTSSAGALITHVVNRLLEPSNGSNGPQYNHNIIVRQFISSGPAVLGPDDAPMAEEKVTFCNATNRGGVVPDWICVPDLFGCNAFSENIPSRSLLGFNEQVTSNLSWDSISAPLLSIFSLRPRAANNVTELETSQSWNLGVDFSIQGTLDAELNPPHVGLSVKGPSGTIDWKWSESRRISIPDWKTQPGGGGSAPATYDFFANGGANSLANLMMHANSPGDDVLSYTDLTDLQKSRLEYRDESDWITTGGNHLPPAKARLTSQLILNYGEVFEQYAAVDFTPAGMHSYGALHKFTITLPFEFDFSQPVLQPPLKATWTVSAKLGPLMDRYFQVQGTVNLLGEPSSETTILLGAEIYDFGNSSPAPTVIDSLPTQVTIPAGQLNANFAFRALRIGHPYNVRLWAFKSTGQQVAYPMTVPAK